ncbi:hypothetical protein AB2M62_08245 [Sphingomonas sp. MMS12-HWE2-04]|uniref:hypothetical protein n=1 Tax=Sphingomonas sp. MMS12-HWE2-04 TaxID=3234199 RepID=UPI00384C99DE
MLKAFAALSLALFAPAVTVAASPTAPDPCQRAIAEAQEAEDAVNNWYASHCRPGGSKQCTGNGARLIELLDRMQAARANRQRQCS